MLLLMCFKHLPYFRRVLEWPDAGLHADQHVHGGATGKSLVAVCVTDCLSLEVLMRPGSRCQARSNIFTNLCMPLIGLCLQDVTVAGADGGGGSSSSIAAGSWLNPGDPALASIPPDAVINRCSPSPIAAVAFFCSFVLLCGLVLVNFVIAVIIDNFQSSCQTDDLPVSKASVDEFSGVSVCRWQQCPAWQLHKLMCLP